MGTEMGTEAGAAEETRSIDRFFAQGGVRARRDPINWPRKGAVGGGGHHLGTNPARPRTRNAQPQG